MATRKLDRDETDFMRDYIQEGVDRGETEEQIKERRLELTRIVDCTIKQVAGAVAWKKDQNEEKLILKPLELPSNPEEQVQPPTQESQIQSVESSTSFSSADTEIGTPPESTPIETTPVPQINSPDELPTHVRVHPKSGAWVDFENSEIKETWRQAEAEFIDRHVDIDSAKRAEMRVLCTPGIKCYKEVQHLLRKGIKPENIFAVEREKAAWGEFETNCRAAGIRPVFGELQELLPHQAPFDIVCIDFLGQLSKANLRVLQKLPLRDRAVISVNMLAKREGRDIQEELSQMQFQYDGTHKEEQATALELALSQSSVPSNIATTLQNPTDADILRLAAEIQEQTEKTMSTKFTSVSDEVRDTALWSSLRHAGVLNERHWKYLKMFTPFPFHPIFLQEGRNSTSDKVEILQRACSKSFGPDIFRVEFALRAAGLLSNSDAPPLYSLDALALSSNSGLRQITSVEKYKYLSSVGQTRSPFVTNLAVVERPTKLYQDVTASAAFLLQSVREVLRDAAADLDTDFQFIIERNGTPLPEGFRASKSDRIVGKRIAGGTARTRHSITVEQYVRDYSRYNNGMAEYPLNNFATFKNIQRKTIE